MQLILASNSPRRKEILQKYGVRFKVKIGDYKETIFSNEPIETAITFALGKAQSVYNALKEKNDIVVLGADTVVYHDGKILGKAHSEEQARKMLKSLSGKTHTVVTGYALVGKEKVVKGYSVSDVKFNVLTEKVINSYIDSGLYKGKAGSYGIQDGYNLVESYSGSYENIVGLPIEDIIKEIKSFNRSNNE